MKIPFKFIVRKTTRIPTYVLVGQGKASDPIYPALKKIAFDACLRYLEEGERFLLGDRKTPPDISSVIAKAIPHGAMLKAKHQKVGRDRGYIKLTFQDADRNEKRSPRLFDPPFLVALILLSLPGGSYRFNDSESKDVTEDAPELRRFFLSFGRGEDQNLALLRIIFDATPYRQVHRHRSSRHGHYDYRRAWLQELGDVDVLKAKLKARPSERGREHAISIACKHLEKVQRNNLDTLPDNSLTPDSFRRLLHRAFNLADRMTHSLADEKRK